jgi:hypothetical protein
MEICFKLMVIKRNVVSYCLKDFSLCAGFLVSAADLLDVQALGCYSLSTDV